MTSNEAIPYFDLTGQFTEVKQDWFDEIERLGRAGNFILGDAISEFESSIADYLGVSHAVSVSSGTDALVLALRALGVGQGDSVIVPDFTFFATAEAVSLAGATPVFIDIDPVSLNMNVNKVEIALRNDTKAILPVHLFGAPADIGSISDLATNKGIAVVEDAAQAFTAKIGERFVGSASDAGCFSFYPTKVLGAFGDGGMIATNNDSLAEELRLLRNHGVTGANVHSLIGSTSRLNCVQAKLLQVKLKLIDEKARQRRDIASMYFTQLEGLDLELPRQQPGTTHAYNIFTVRSRSRDKIAEALKINNIGYQIYYPMPLHQQIPYRHLGYSDAEFPESMRAAKEVISLPLYPEMPSSHVDRICNVIHDAID